ncbi:MAG: tetratricopeptide repeat protein [Patescibacteria group bacterium]
MKKLVTGLTILLTLTLAILGLILTNVIQINNEPQKITVVQKETRKDPEPSSPTYFEHLEKGDGFVKKNNDTLAFNEYVLANKINPEAVEPLLKIGKLHLKRRDYERALEIFLNVLKKDSANIEGNINLIKTYIGQGKPQKALDLTTTIQQQNDTIDYYKGLLYAYFGKYDDSKKILGVVTQKNTNPEIQKNAQEILKSYEVFSSTQGSQLIYLKTLIAKNLNQAKEFQLTIPLLFQVVQEKKDYRDAWILLGYAYLNEDDTKNAIDALEQAQKLDPHKPETVFFLGLAYQSQNKIKAIALIEEAITKGFEPKIQAKQKLADLYFDTGKYDQAAKNYEDVINLNSDDLSYFTRPLWIYIEKLQDGEKASALAQKALEKHPENAMSYNFLGWALLAKKDYNGARDNLGKAIQKDPKLAVAYLNLGRLFEEINYQSTAKDYYKTAFEMGKGTSISNSAAEKYNLITQKENNALKTSVTP